MELSPQNREEWKWLIINAIVLFFAPICTGFLLSVLDMSSSNVTVDLIQSLPIVFFAGFLIGVFSKLDPVRSRNVCFQSCVLLLLLAVFMAVLAVPISSLSQFLYSFAFTIFFLLAMVPSVMGGYLGAKLRKKREE